MTMKQRLMPVLLFSIFLGLYFLMHYYVFSRIAGWLNISNPLHLLYLMLALFVSFPLFSVAERFFDSGLVRFMYYLSSLWLGFVFFLFFATLLAELIIFVLHFSGMSVSSAMLYYSELSVLFLSFLAVAYGIYSARKLSVSHITIPVKNLPSSLSKFVIVQLSDIHAGAINGSSFVRRNVEIANSLDPDVVVITGDLFDGTCVHSEEHMRNLVLPLKDLRPRFASFFVTGNHEKYIGLDITSRIVSSLGVTPLRNSTASVKGICFVGIDNPPEEMRRRIPELEKMNLPQDSPIVLLYHIPLGMPDAARHGVFLQLSGHTHGGQIFPFNLLEKLFFPSLSGLVHRKYSSEDFFLYVSRGSGTWGPPMRIMAPPEIVRITLVPAH